MPRFAKLGDVGGTGAIACWYIVEAENWKGLEKASALVGLDGGTRGARMLPSALAASAEASDELRPKAPARPLWVLAPFGRQKEEVLGMEEEAIDVGSI